MQGNSNAEDRDPAATNQSREHGDRAASREGDGQMTHDAAGGDYSAAAATPAPVAADGGVTPAQLRTGLSHTAEVEDSRTAGVTAPASAVASADPARATGGKRGDAGARPGATPVEEAKDEDEMQESEGAQAAGKQARLNRKLVPIRGARGEETKRSGPRVGGIATAGGAVTDSRTYDQDSSMPARLRAAAAESSLTPAGDAADFVKAARQTGSMRSHTTIAMQLDAGRSEHLDESPTRFDQTYMDKVLGMGQGQTPRRNYMAPMLGNQPSGLAGTSQGLGGQLSTELGMYEHRTEAMSGRHQSVDARGGPQYYAPSADHLAGIVSQQLPGGRMDVGPSHLSGIALSNQSPLIEEVRKNNFQRVSKLMDQFIIGKINSGTVTGRASQQKARNIKNSFQTGVRQRSGIDRSSTKFTDTTNPDYPGAVGPKRNINIPKQLIMYQLSKNIDADLLEKSISHTAITAQHKSQLMNTASFGRPEPNQQRSYLDFIEGSVTGADASDRSIIEHPAGALQAHSSFLQKHGRSPFANTKSFRTIDANPSSILDLVKDSNNLLPGNDGAASFQNLRQDQSQISGGLGPSPSVPSFLGRGGHGMSPSPSPALTNFHITDLLERSILTNAREREQNKLRQIIDFYKRQVKDEKSIKSRKEVMIRNYRLHVVKDADREIDPKSRSLFTLNKGTSIHVSNSIIRPEIHKFATKISDKLTEVYPFLADDSALLPKAKSPQKRHRRGGSMTVSSQGRRGEHLDHDGYLIEEYDEIARQEMRKQRMEDRRSEAMMQEGQDMEETADEEAQIEHEGLADLDDGLSSRPFTPADNTELEAIKKTNRIFDRWLRNVFSQQSAALARPARAKLQNGQPEAPKVLDINWAIAVSHGTLIKEKPLPLSRLTSKSFYDSAPYRFLQMLVVNNDIREWYSKFILKTQTIKTYDQLANHELQSMTFADCKVAIDFSRHHLTHLDPVVFRDDNLPLELFVDYEYWIRPPAKGVRALRVENELRDERNQLGLEARTHYFMRDGSRNLIDVMISDFNPVNARFLVRNWDLNIATWRSRLYVEIPGDSKQEMEENRVNVIQRKADALQYLRVHRLVNEEMTKRYSYIKLSDAVLKAIQERLAVNLLAYNPDSVRKNILQIEALYVFSILKATLSSQRHDPFIKELLLKYKITLDSPALTYAKTQHKEKSDLDGIQEYNMKGIKVELNHNSLLLMDAKYIKMPIFLNSLTERTIGAHKLFRCPFDVNLLMAQNSREFRKMKKEEIDSMINQFPLHHDKFVQAQEIMSKYFHRIAKFRWAEAIQSEIWQYVKDDFHFESGVDLTEEQVDPVLLRLFYQLKLYMQTVIFEHFETALRDYLYFLLSFILRDVEMKENKIVQDIKFNQHVRLGLQKTSGVQLKKGELVNDIDLIPRKNKPMILIDVLIEDYEVPNKHLTKQRPVTQPELDKVSKELFFIIQNMHVQLQEIDRVDKLIFPLLDLEEPFLLVPDVKNEKLAHYVRIIEKLIEQSLRSTKKQIEEVKAYMGIFDKRKESIITDLKIKSFEMQQDLSEDGEGTRDGQQAEQAAKAAKEETGEDDSSDDGSGEEEDADGDEGGRAGNDLAYKSQDINDDLMRDELFSLRELVWKVLGNIHNQYDFGMVYLDCQRFKDRMLQHINGLIDHLENYIRADFTTKQKAIQKQIKSVKGELDKEVESIDEVINLLLYIDSLKKQDNQIAEISLLIADLATRMDYIESVKIRFPDHQYAQFLDIRNWPNTFRQYIEQRKMELLAQKDELYALMSKEIENVFRQIGQFRKQIDDILNKGLEDRQLTYDAESDDVDSDDSQKQPPTAEELEAKRLEQQRQEESAEGKTFTWLAKQRDVEMSDKDFNKKDIVEVYDEIEKLKQDYDNVERECGLINKREALLNVKKTEFSALAKIQDDLKPLFALWSVAAKVAKTLPDWVEGRFELLDAGLVETRIDEWVNELKRLQKSALIKDNPMQDELLQFMFKSLVHLKKYSPMLRTLRTKGLAPRHWRMIASKLEVKIDLSSITLYRLIMLKLYEEEKLKTVKQICEIATKEYAVQMALESLDKEMRAVEFEFQISSSPFGPSEFDTVVILRLPEVIAMFEEFYLRASVLKSNPHIKNFFEKLLEIEKIIKNVVELVQEWAVFQRNFIYLNGIFCQEEIAAQLPNDAKTFVQVQQLYQSTTASFQTNPQVHRIFFRENFLAMLMKNNAECDHIRSGLMTFLEKKRGKFPRLFFLSNEELIDIFGKGPMLVEFLMEDESKSFIGNIFEGVDRVRFTPGAQDLTHMISKDGEEVHLFREVTTRHVPVDSWLKYFEIRMKETVKDALFCTFEQMDLQDFETWVSSWPGQALFLSSQLWYSMRVEAIYAASLERERVARLAGEDNADDKTQQEPSVEPDETGDQQESKEDSEDPFGEVKEVVDPEVADERAYLEELARQVKKEEDTHPEKALVEKLLRLRARFRVNKKKAPGEQLEKLQDAIVGTIIQFTGMVRKKLKNNVRAAATALLTGYVHLRDVNQSLIRDRVYKAENFQWQMQFKFSMKNLEEVVEKELDNNTPQRRLDSGKLEVDCEVFGNIREYGFEYLGNCQRLVVTPLTERCQRSLLIALQYQYGGAPEGPFGTGKTETTKDLARQVAKMSFVLNSSANYEYLGVVRFFKGLASSGAWVVFDEFNRMDAHILSLISQVIITIQNAIRKADAHLQLDEAKIALNKDCAVFITLNPGYAGRSELPINLKSLFRPISMVVPDSVFITEILLYAAGFIGAQQLAKKIVQVQALANVVMKKTEIAHDFGLRSIKAIISIAEALKLNAQNTTDCPLTEMVDDATLSSIPYKSDQIVKEVMAESQARIAEAVAQQKQMSGDGTVSSMNKTKSKKTKEKFDNELVKIDEAAENDASPDPRTGGTDKDIGKRKGLDLEDVKAEDGAMRESMTSMPDGEGEKGHLYKALWGKMTFAERQRRIVYLQIGIDPDQHYDEEELEEYIVLKAVRDYNHSKFAATEHILIEGTIKDIFQGAVPDLDKPTQDYGCLKEALYQCFENLKIDFSPALRTKALQFFEIQRSKHGCILVGDPQSGKTTLIQLLQSALNKIAKNEMMLAVQDLRRSRLLEKASEYEAEAVKQQTQQATQRSGKSSAMAAGEMIGAASKKKSKKADAASQAKKLLEKWQQMYQETKLTAEEVLEIRSRLVTKGVNMRRLNPKGMTTDELFGHFDKESHEWQMGLFTQHFREFSAMRDDKKKWILLDGPIDYMWVENLNSILDDNRKMTLPNGESIKMSEGMCILLETNNMRNVTPATVSRCGLIYMHKKETCDSKALFNQFLRKLPPNLAEYAKEMEAVANYLMVEAIAVYRAEAKQKRLRYPHADLHWLIQNFVRLLQTLIFDYYVEYERSLAAAPVSNQNEFGKSLFNMTLGNKWVDMVDDPNETIYAADDDEESIAEPPVQTTKTSRSGSRAQSRAQSQASQRRVATPDARALELEKKKRLPRTNFIDSEIRFEGALKFTPIWLESFVLFSLVWTFHPVLSDMGRKVLDHKLLAKYAGAQAEFSAYQKEKKRKLAEKNREKSQSNKQSIDKAKSVSRASAILSKKSSEKDSAVGGSVAKGQVIDSQPNNDGLTPVWTDNLEEKPMLISDYPENTSFYDCFFNVEGSGWSKFSLAVELSDAKLAFGEMIDSQKKMQNFFVPSAESIRHSFLLEAYVTNQVSTLVVGPAGAGASTFLRETLFAHVFNYTKALQTDHVSLSSHTDSTVLKDNVERLLEWRTSKVTGEKVLRPHLDNKLICFIEDLHMSMTDDHGDQPAIEAVRDYLTQGAWLSSRKRRWREIEDVSVFTCMAQNAPETAHVSGRCLHQFNLIVMDEPTVEGMKNIYSQQAEILVGDWGSSMQIYASNIADTLIDLATRVFTHLKPTPMKAHYTFTWRDVGKILLSIQMIEANSLKHQVDVMKLVYHECLRTVGDRLLMSHDRKWFYDTLKAVCREHFYCVDKLEVFDQRQKSPKKKKEGDEDKQSEAQNEGGEDEPVPEDDNDEIDPKRLDQFIWPDIDPQRLYYSTWNQEVEGFYMQVEDIDKIQKTIQEVLDRYNDSNERVRIDLMLYNQLNRLMLRVLRAISQPNGHLILVAMKGFGMNHVVKLVTFAANHQLREPEAYEGIQLDEWQQKLRQSVIYTANEDKPLTFYVDEYKMLFPQQYEDLSCLLKNSSISEIVRKSDIMLSLTNIYQQAEAERKAKKFGSMMDDEDRDTHLTAKQRAEKQKMEEEQQQDFIADNKKMMMKYPQVQADCYRMFLNRVAANFHLLLQYTPTGGGFREKISQHKELMYHSQMVFMSDLPAPELEALGESFFKLELEKAKSRAMVEGKPPPKSSGYSVSNDQESQNRVLSCIVKMFLQAQDMAKKFADEVGQTIYLTPVQFLRVFKCYKKLLKQRQVNVKDISGRYDEGLEKIRRKQDEIYEYHKRLEEEAPVLFEKQRQLMRVINEIQEQLAKIQAERDQLKREEFEAERAAEQAAKIKQDCEDTLNEILPSLREALQLVQTLTKKDVSELRSLKHPPKVVKLVLQAVCMILGIEPEEKISKKTGKPKLSYWKAAQGPAVLGDPLLPKKLLEFRRETVQPETMLEVEEVLNSHGYSHEKAKTAYVAASSLFKWVNATREYFYIYKEIEPSRDNVRLATEQYLAKQQDLEEKRAKIAGLDQRIAELKEHQKSKDDIIEEVKAEIEDCGLRKKRADTLLKGLSAEKQKWVVCTRMLSTKYSTVTGDVLLSAGYISLIGAFDQRHRLKLLSRWSRALTDGGFTCSQQFELTELFGDSYKIRRWHVNALPADQMSVCNALTTEKTKQFCLLIDPQMQGITWLKNQYDDGGTLTIMKQGDSQFKRQCEIAIDLGRTVIIDGVGAKIDLNLQSLMRKQVTKYGGSRTISFCRKQYKYDKNFKLFVVSPEANPHFDVNISNHVCMLNFSVNLESLQAQMLDLVVRNERKDLEDQFGESQNDAFESIKQLKDIEAAILGQLDTEVQELLGEESLIRTLAESKNTAEYTASKLRNMTQTNQFIGRARELYAPVAYRAAVLYFVVQDLQKMNKMYKFSLTWFKQLCERSLELTNVMRDEPGRAPDSDDESADLKLLNNSFSVDERVQLLSKTFTSELFKRLQMALFARDRQLATYVLAARVQEAENFLERGLFDFLIGGSRSVSPTAHVPPELDAHKLPGLTDMAWADLQYLSSLKPFNAQNLLSHIMNQPQQWKAYLVNREGRHSFEDLPNKNELDMRFFTQMDDDELESDRELQVPKLEVEPPGTPPDGAKSEKGREAGSQLGARTQGDTNSRVGSQGLKRTESEILRDPDIWNVSSSDEDSAQDDAKSMMSKAGDGDNRETPADSDIDSADASAEFDQTEMARYLIETAPSVGKGRGGGRSNIDSLRRKTVSERQLILRKENAVKALCELAVLKCLRPDMLISGLDRFARNVVDPSYFDFNEDILAPYFLKKKRSSNMSGVGQALAKRVLGDKLADSSKLSVTDQSQSNMQQTSQGRLGGAAGMDDTQKSGKMTTNSSAKNAKLEAEKLERERREKRGGINNIKNLVREAYQDSDCRSPIFFFVTHSVNIYGIVEEFYQRQQTGSKAILHHYSMGKGSEEMVEETLLKSAQNGDWILLENMHLVRDWLPIFDEKLSKLKGSELNQRFRVWITSVPTDDFPQSILEKSIKVAMQPPTTIRARMERMLIEQEKENFFRKSGRSSHVHKNLWFSLAYLHSLVEGRVQYGALGWHVPYKFDHSEFEISNAQLSLVMKNTNIENRAKLEMLKYCFSQVNYAGKIQRYEDQRTLEVIVADLFTEDLAMADDATNPDLSQSHFGYPPDYTGTDFFAYVDRCVPAEDPCEVYGFNWNIQRQFKTKQSATMLELFIEQDKIRSPASRKYPNMTLSVDEMTTSIEINSFKTSLQASGTDSGSQIKGMLSQEASLLNLFIALQKLLEGSSLHTKVLTTTKRYDHQTDQDELPKRDLNDKKVVEMAAMLIKQLEAEFDQEIIEKKFPIRYRQPMNNVINRELSCLRILLRAITESVADLLANIDGKYPRPFEIEALWTMIQQNRVPDKWLRVSFETSYTSLADYIVELGLKLDFWRKAIDTDFKSIPSIWLPAFFDPKSFLAALIQTRARGEEIPMKDLENEYRVMDYYKSDKPPTEPHVMYIHGLYLEGADWDANRKLLVEIADSRNYVPFPCIRVRTKRVHEDGNVREDDRFANFTNQKHKDDSKKKQKVRQDSVATGAEAVDPIQTFLCPLYKTPNRLSKGIVSSDKAPVDYIGLPTMDPPSKWTKRSVAFVLEIERAFAAKQ